MIGPYKLLEFLGEGGIGIVWLAERRDPIVQHVALKVIKPGMDARSVIARFEQERQALVLMNHPNAARVFDAGTTPDSRPYFAMGHVRGEAITDYCDRQKLSVRQRIELFIPVCEANGDQGNGAEQGEHTLGAAIRELERSWSTWFAVRWNFGLIRRFRFKRDTMPIPRNALHTAPANPRVL
jgi:serine/threonine protein kinase